MSEFVIHGVPGSPFVRAVLMDLEEKGLGWRLQALGPGDARSRQPRPFSSRSISTARTNGLPGTPWITNSLMGCFLR